VSDGGWEATSVAWVATVCADPLVTVAVAVEAQALIKNATTMKSEKIVAVDFLLMILPLFGLKHFNESGD
jgi:hypothetical protein